jgi:uncharacterized protein (TIGR00299 family) protein
MAEHGPTLAWFHCFAGIAGDMALGALLDAGADVDEVRGLVERVPVSGWHLEVRATERNGIGATSVVVHAPATSVVRTWAHITGLLEEARLPERVLARASAAFAALAEVEGRIHRRPPEAVHFHELGGIDAIVDIVGVASALEVLGVDEVASSAVATGSGVVRTAHGLLPNPAPAVVELLAGAPVRGLDLPVELTTPTGAALLATLARRWGPLPAMTVDATGFGAGTAELDALPNVTQVVLGSAMSTEAPAGQPLTVLEANVDDATGETLAVAVAALLDAGAADAWVTPIVMKKGRPAHTVSALCDPALVASLTAVLATETGTFGVRSTPVTRWPAARRSDVVEVAGAPVRVKVGPGRVKVEHDDAARVARRTGLPVREVVSRAEEAWRQRGLGEVVELPGPPDTSGDAG